ncbi:Adhesion G protein-coupled receptor L3 [Characodon lateralis]|uniref:Adhesion G protein-coupled receptor L3 n=1 Tax=Characodon lateralis TaxID=208331 RepID=A0ABU7E1N0_9TELE|nr:Adhesion G protein-coupled receptor L3 [Characodon lateralis]
MSSSNSPRPSQFFLFPTKLIICNPQAMVETVNNLLQPQAQAAWRALSTGEQLRAATMLLDTVEQGAFVLADNLLKTDIVQENTDNIRKYILTLLCTWAYKSN